MLKFGAGTAALLEESYLGRDFVNRRYANLRLLGPRPGESIADIGCGNGLLTLELSRAVGPDGRVHGIDPSADMLQAARARCDARDNVTLSTGTADNLPMEDDSLDAAVSIQVFEYLEDIPAALAEARRALRPGGRLVIGDMHADTLIWHSDNADRMQRMLRAWDRHFTQPRVPALLPDLLRQAGFVVEVVEPLTFLDTTYRPDGLARMLSHLMASFAVSRKLLAAAEADAWQREQDDLAAAGRFFFHYTHVVIAARKPDH